MESSTSLKIGDFICLFSEDAQGFVYTDDTSIKNNGLKVHGLQDDDDFSIPDVQVVTFQVLTVNRYNLNKQYRKLCKANRHESSEESKTLLTLAKAAAEAEEKDNQAEQSRLLGRPLRYGDLVQLCHVFTNKFLMVSAKESSTVDKNKILIRLNSYNSKNAQFKILPGFKVKMEGEQVELGDQIIFESLKSAGNYMHVTCDNASNDMCEVNCGIDKSVFTIIKHFSPAESIDSKKPILRGGSVLQFHHKDLDAYIAAQGVCGETLQKDAHLRVQSFGALDSRSMYPPKDADTYWQVVLASSPLLGQYVKWQETSFHLRHMPTRLYLAVTDKGKPKLVPKVGEHTLFTFHTLLHGPMNEYVHIGETVRLHNEDADCWLYGVGDIYTDTEGGDDASEEPLLENIQWEDSPRIKLLAREEKKYPDAFIVHQVSTQDIHVFNFIVGLAPFLHGIKDRMNSSTALTTKEFIDTEETLDELKTFIEPVKRDRDKCKQNTMRGAGLIDLLVGVLKGTERQDTKTLSIFRTIHEVLYKYSFNNSVENNLYCAPFLKFFTQQLLLQNDVGYRCCLTMIELIRNNRVITDRVNPQRIREVVALTRNAKKHYILDLLGTVCVCDDIAITENQNIIADTLILENTECMFHIQLGKDVGEMRKNDILFISTDNRETWTPLYRFVTDGYPEKTEEGYLYFVKQIQLIKKLVHGHNQHTLDLLTKRRDVLPWEVVFQGLTSGHLPDTVKTMFCDLVIWLFVEGSQELPKMSHICTNFVYRRINSDRPDMDDFQVESKSMDDDMPGLRTWMYDYLSQNTRLVKSEPQRNLFIAEITALLHSLIQYQYIGTGQEIHDVKTILFQYVSGIRDAHVLPQNKKDYTRAELEQIMDWSRSENRYAPSKQTDAMMNAKLRCLDLLELLMSIQTHRRLKYILAMFKDTHNLLGKHVRNESHQARMVTLIMQELSSKDLWCDTTFKNGKKQNKPNPLRKTLQRFVKDMHKKTDVIDPEVSVFLMELTNYKNLKIRQKVISLLNKYFSSKLDMLNTAIRSQIITSLDSERIQHEADSALPIMMKVARSKGELDTMSKLCQVLEKLIRLCYASGVPQIPCVMSQNIFVNNGFLSILLNLATVKCEPIYKERYALTVEVATKCLQLIQAMAKGNDYVQQWIFDHLTFFLFEVTITGPQCAATLTEAFQGNHKLCSKVFPNNIEEIVSLGGRTRAVEWLTLLKLLVRDDASGKVISRNQSFVIKMLMQNFKRTGYPLKMTKQQRLSLLVENPPDDTDRRYYIELVDMLVACAQGSTGYIVSVCQKLLPVTEILDVLNHENIDFITKSPFAFYLVQVYLHCTEKELDHVIKEVFLDIQLWDHVALLSHLIGRYVSDTSAATEEPRLDDGNQLMEYMLRSGFSFLSGVFGNCNQFDCDKILDTTKAAEEMEQILPEFSRVAMQYCTRYSDLIEMEKCLETVSKKAGKIVFEDGFFGQSLSRQVFVTMRKKLLEPPSIFVKDANEMDLNRKLKVFTSNLIHVVQGDNTIAAQLHLKDKRLMSIDYVSEYSDTPLPLGDEFHKHIHCFGSNDTQDYENTVTLLEILEVSSMRIDPPTITDNEIDLKCLQILRALLHNLICQLPQNWEDDIQTWKKLLSKIKHLQDILSEEGIVQKVMPLMDRSGLNIGKEVFCILDCLLFNANRNIQRDVYNYFVSTREECFFRFIRNRLHLAMLALKERRDTTHKKVPPKDPAPPPVDAAEVDPPNGQPVMEEPDDEEGEEEEKEPFSLKSKIQGLSCLKFRKNKLVDPGDDWIEAQVMENNNVTEQREPVTSGDKVAESVQEDHVDHSSKSDVEIVLSVSGKLCDGQNKIMQDYLRQQPDNVMSVNIVAELTQFVGVMYTRVTSYTINMCTNLFATLHEMSEGNQDNRSTLIDNKIVDYLNFLLRRKNFYNCDVDDVLNLRSEMAGLILALMEENGEQETATAMDVCETVAVDDLKAIMTVCYTVPALKLGEASIESGMNELELQYTSRSGNFNMMRKKQGSENIEEVYEKLTDIGHLYYCIIARIADIDKSVDLNDFEFTIQKKAFAYFKARSRSVEVMKDGHLQKKHFRVKNTKLLREEIKEHVKWEVDRSSPTSKLRDLLSYSKDILKDIDYQKKLQSKKFLGELATRWVVWHYLCILLSLVITIFMLVTWKSPYTAEQIPSNETSIPDDSPIYQKEADYNHLSRPTYRLVLNILGGIHCFCSAMLLFCYLLLYHPAFPNWLRRLPSKIKVRNVAGKKVSKAKEKEPEVQEAESKLEMKFFSADTLYYLLMLAMSVLGVFYFGYFFAFHLLGIVNINPLLKGVIRAITYNGRSLVWVGILGVIVIYIYTLFVFAFFRDSIFESEEFFCSTLSECFVSVLRYGTIGDITDKVHLNGITSSFSKFGYLTLYQVTFFILFTTIGLNIIFGIIVDTFSEIRDKKWVAEKDMNDVCFICSKDSFDFEHHGKGFFYHVHEEHNMWDYVFYFIYLHEREEKDYTSIDMHVARLLKTDSLDFFPMNCALGLSTDGEDGETDALATVIAAIDNIQNRLTSQEVAFKKLVQNFSNRRNNRTSSMYQLPSGISQLRERGAKAQMSVPERQVSISSKRSSVLSDDTDTGTEVTPRRVSFPDELADDGSEGGRDDRDPHSEGSQYGELPDQYSSQDDFSSQDEELPPPPSFSPPPDALGEPLDGDSQSYSDDDSGDDDGNGGGIGITRV